MYKVEACGAGLQILKRNVTERKSNWNKNVVINNVITVMNCQSIINSKIGCTIILALET
jgi:hypothetical protein